MRKIYIITRHSIVNHGSILQAMATIVFFRKNGFEPFIIDYVNKKEKFPRIVFESLKANKSWNKNFIKKIIYILVKFPSMLFANIRFKKYRKHNLRLTKRFYKLDNFKVEQNAILCSGSDQLWGPIIDGKIDDNYMLSFSKQNIKIAFASSIGRNIKLSDKECNYLKMYKFISTREKSSCDYLKSIGVYNTFNILDPTLMIERKYWLDFISKTKVTPKEYILVYKLHESNEFEKYIKKISKMYNMPVIRMTNSFDDILLYGNIKNSVTPQKFLKYIESAKYILTDSFHCTVFSTIFHKKFIAVNPGKTSLRISEYLQELGIDNHLISSFDDCTTIKDVIDYNAIDDKLDMLRSEHCDLILKGLRD